MTTAARRCLAHHARIEATACLCNVFPRELTYANVCMQHLESLGFIGWAVHLLSCDLQDDALLQAAALAVAACAAHHPQRAVLHAHGIERVTGARHCPQAAFLFSSLF